jgi:hypothetical protein
LKNEQRILKTIALEMEGLDFQYKRGLERYTQVVQGAKTLMANNYTDTKSIDSKEIINSLMSIRLRWAFGKGNTTNIYDALIGSSELKLVSSPELREKLRS